MWYQYFTAEISASHTGKPQFWSPSRPGAKCKAGHPQQKGQLKSSSLSTADTSTQQPAPVRKIGSPESQLLAGGILIPSGRNGRNGALDPITNCLRIFKLSELVNGKESIPARSSCHMASVQLSHGEGEWEKFDQGGS